MEKYTHTFTSFGANVSLREKRVTFMTDFEVPKNEVDHGKLEDRIKSDIKDPSVSQEDIDKRVKNLKDSSEFDKGTNPVEYAEILKAVKKRNEEKADRKKIVEKGTPADATWKKIVDGIKGKAKPDEAAVKEAQKLIGESMTEMHALAMKIATHAVDTPHNAFQQIEAWNNLIVNIQALDPDNKITFLKGIGGAEDDKVLEALKVDHTKFLKTDGAFNIQIVKVENARTAEGKKGEVETLKKIADARKGELVLKIQGITERAGDARYVNTEQQVAELLRQKIVI